MGSTLEVILTIIAMSFWFLFPIGMFLSVSHVDKNTDQVIRLDHLRHESVETEAPKERIPEYRPQLRHIDWSHPIMYFRRWLNEP
jgi:hypothetical protein